MNIFKINRKYTMNIFLAKSPQESVNLITVGLVFG